MRQAFVRSIPGAWRFVDCTTMRCTNLRWCKVRSRAETLRYTETRSAVRLHPGNLMIGRSKALSGSQYTTVSASLLLAEPSTRSRGDVE